MRRLFFIFLLGSTTFLACDTARSSSSVGASNATSATEKMTYQKADTIKKMSAQEARLQRMNNAQRLSVPSDMIMTNKKNEMRIDSMP